MLKVTQNRLNKRFKIWYEFVQSEQQMSCFDVNQEKQKKKAALTSLENELELIKNKYLSGVLRKYPAIVFVHQIPRSHTSDVKFMIEELKRTGKIMLIDLPLCTPSSAIVFIKDLAAWIKSYETSNDFMINFIEEMVPQIKSSKIPKLELNALNLTERKIKQLINFGLLVNTQDSVYELTIPCAGQYSKAFLKGRNALIAALNRNPEKELLKSEILKNDNICSKMSLGLNFHICDIVGLQLADCIETTGGQLIRYLNMD